MSCQAKSKGKEKDKSKATDQWPTV